MGVIRESTAERASGVHGIRQHGIKIQMEHRGNAQDDTQTGVHMIMLDLTEIFLTNARRAMERLLLHLLGNPCMFDGLAKGHILPPFSDKNLPKRKKNVNGTPFSFDKVLLFSYNLIMKKRHTPDAKETIMATTSSTVQAGIAYRAQQQAIYQQIDQLKALLHQHETRAKADGPHWGHVGDLTRIIATLQDVING